MFQELFADGTLLIWPKIGLVLFVICFAGVLLYVFFGLRSKEKVDRLSSLPLENETLSSDNGADGNGRNR